jgi:hypothetical protein
VRSAVLGCALVFAATAAAPATDANSQYAQATAVVSKFYSWYLAHHGQVEKRFHDVKALFDPELFEFIDETYYKNDDSKEPAMYVSTTSARNSKMASLDPYVNAAVPAISYTLGSPAAGHDVYVVRTIHPSKPLTFVPVTFGFAGTASTTRVEVMVVKNASAYQIFDIHYIPVRFYYAGPISDLIDFLAAYNC